MQYTVLTAAHAPHQAASTADSAAGRHPTAATIMTTTMMMMMHTSFLGNSIGSDTVAALTALLSHDGPFLLLRLARAFPLLFHEILTSNMCSRHPDMP